MIQGGLGDLSLLLNADLGLQSDADTSYYGASLALGYPLANWASVAVRGEYLAYPDNTKADFAKDDDGAVLSAGAYESLVTGTLTLDFKPVPNKENVIIRGDLRYELADGDAFADVDGEPTAGWYTAVLGAVVTTN